MWFATSIDHNEICALNFSNMSHDMAYRSHFDVHWAPALRDFERQDPRILRKQTRDSDSTDKAHPAPKTGT
jgi:hypothetical protein